MTGRAYWLDAQLPPSLAPWLNSALLPTAWVIRGTEMRKTR